MRLKCSALLLVAALGPRAAAEVTVQAWLTTGDQASKLARQPDLVFSPDGGPHGTTVSVSRETTYQTMEGFGASLTDSSAWLIEHKLSPAQRNAWLRKLFSPDDGIGITYLRQPMGASDFATSWYTYDDMPVGQTDPDLEHFSVAHDDAYIVPNLHRAKALNPQLKVMGSPWSAPAWMKTSLRLGGGSLRPEYHTAYANYFVRYVREYEARGIPIHAITIQNEPHNDWSGMPTMYMSWWQQAEFIKHHLGPAFQSEGIDTKILIWDHSWDNPGYPLAILNDTEANPYVAGSAWHAYAGDASAQSVVHDAFPDKEIYFTEITGGGWWEVWSDNLVWGLHNVIIGATRNWAKTVTYWNLALDTNHGPRIGGCTNCRGLTTIHPDTGEVDYTEEYYVVGHASKFVQPGAYRIASDTFPGQIESVAFWNPDGSEVLIALNPSNTSRAFDIERYGQHFSYLLPPQSVVTFKYLPVPSTLTWDQLGDGSWEEIDPGTGNSHWQDEWGNPLRIYPNETIRAVVKGDTVSVVGSHAARYLTVESGGVVVDATGTLTVAEGVDVAAGASLGVAGTLAADSFSSAGTNTVTEGAIIAVTSGLTLNSSLDMTGATLTTSPSVTNIRVNRDGVLTVGHALVGAELHVAGQVQAAGAEVHVLNVTDGGRLDPSADVTAENVNLTGGAIHLTGGANLDVAVMQLSGGILNTGTGHIAIGESLKIRETLMSITHATFKAKSSNLADPSVPDNLTLTGGKLAVLFPGPGYRRILLVSDQAPGGADDPLVSLVESLGHSVDTSGMGGAYQETHDPFNDPVKLAALSDADLVLVSRATRASRYDADRQQWNGLQTPLVLMNGYLTRDGRSPKWGWVAGDCDAADRTEEEMIVEAGQKDHLFLAGLTSPVQLFDWTNAPDGQAPRSVYLPRAGTQRDATHLLATFDGGPYLMDIPAGFDLDQGEPLTYGVTGERRVFMGHWGYDLDPYEFDSFITEDFRTLFANVLANAGPGPLEMPNTNITVTADSFLHLNAIGTATLGNLALQHGVALTITGADVRLGDLTAGDLSSIQGDLSIAGSLSLDARPATLDVLGDLLLDARSTYVWGLDAAGSDLVNVSGALTMADQWTLKIDSDAGPIPGNYLLFTCGEGADVGSVVFDLSEAPGWEAGELSIVDDLPGSVYLKVVPEPSTLLLLATGVLCVLLWRGPSMLGFRRPNALSSPD